MFFQVDCKLIALFRLCTTKEDPDGGPKGHSKGTDLQTGGFG